MITIIHSGYLHSWGNKMINIVIRSYYLLILDNKSIFNEKMLF